MEREMVKNGIDCIDQYDKVFNNKKLGLITSISGVDNYFRSTIDIMFKKYHLVALFSPEHGIRGNIGAGEEVDSYKDPYTGVMVYSLYRKDSKRLNKEMIDLVDSIVYDIQDIGCRYYTFISTMYYAMEACENYNKELIILDRINPLGNKVEGNIIQNEFLSFVGAYSICNRYGLTIGELASMIYAERNFHFPLKIIPVEGWKRSMLFPETQNLWIMPSMGIPRFETANLYPGTCLFEGTNISEGRGTTAPFEIIGAPFIDGYKLSLDMNRKRLPGVRFSPAYFTPNDSKYTKILCEGVMLHITNNNLFNAVETGLTLLFTIRNAYPQNFRFLEPYQEGGRKSIELLFGNESITNPDSTLEGILEPLKQECYKFYKRKEKYHKYE